MHGLCDQMANDSEAVDIEELAESAVSKLNKRYDANNISGAEKQDLQTAALESFLRTIGM